MSYLRLANACRNTGYRNILGTPCRTSVAHLPSIRSMPSFFPPYVYKDSDSEALNCDLFDHAPLILPYILLPASLAHRQWYKARVWQFVGHPSSPGSKMGSGLSEMEINLRRQASPQKISPFLTIAGNTSSSTTCALLVAGWWQYLQTNPKNWGFDNPIGIIGSTPQQSGMLGG